MFVVVVVVVVVVVIAGVPGVVVVSAVATLSAWDSPKICDIDYPSIRLVIVIPELYLVYLQDVRKSVLLPC